MSTPYTCDASQCDSATTSGALARGRRPVDVDDGTHLIRVYPHPVTSPYTLHGVYILLCIFRSSRVGTSGARRCSSAGPYTACPAVSVDRAPVIGRSKAAHGRPFSNRPDPSTGYRVTGRGRRTLGTSARWPVWCGGGYKEILHRLHRVNVAGIGARRLYAFSYFYEWSRSCVHVDGRACASSIISTVGKSEKILRYV